jgi:uncharacterized cofD-like protein
MTGPPEAAIPSADRSAATPPACRVVALGGGHGLHATLSALRLLTDDLTAVVTVADDGGSSGRIRRELGLLPPGDLRMALAAMAGLSADDEKWAGVLQHRFRGSGALAGHSLGNLLLAGLLEDGVGVVEALATIGALVGAVGRVLPMSPVPLDLIAEVDRIDLDVRDRLVSIRGQSSIASTPGRVRNVSLLPPGAPACAAAVDAVHEADVVVLGPGSWFTSVIPHLLLHELGNALTTTQARVVVVLNLVPQPGETEDFSPQDLLAVLLEHGPALRIDTVIADLAAVSDPDRLQRYVRGISARLVLSDLAVDGSADRHDPQRLARAFATAFGWPSSIFAGDADRKLTTEVSSVVE